MKVSPHQIACLAKRVGGRAALVFLVAAASWSTAQQPEQAPAPPIPLPHAATFQTRRTDHFLIWYDSSYEALRPLVNRVEGAYDAVVRVGRAYGFAMEDPMEPLRVIFAEAHADYAELAGRVNVDARGAAGFYDPGENISIFGNIVNSPSLAALSTKIDRLSQRIQRDRRGGQRGGATTRAKHWSRDLSRLSAQRDAIVKRFNRLVIQHEAAHQVFFNLGVHTRGADNPVWLVEGLATQFEVAQTNPHGKIHRTNHLRLGDLRRVAGIAPGSTKVSDEVYQVAFDARRLIPLAELVAGEGAFQASAGGLATAYAQSWALVFYLAKQHEEAFSRYLRRVAARPIGVEVDAADELTQFTDAFGVPDERFQRKWLAYMVQLRFDPSSD